MSNELMEQEFKLHPGIRHGPRDVHFPEDMTIEGWIDYGRFLSAAGTAVQFWEARWLSEGRQRFGSAEVNRVIQELVKESASGQLRFDVEGLKRADVLNKCLEWRPELEPEHHYILAKAKLDETAQRMWLDLSIKKKLSPNELQESIKAGTVVKLPPGQRQRHREGFASFEGFLIAWRLLRQQLGDEWKQWTPSEAAEALEYLKPIEEFCNEVRKTVSQNEKN